MNAMTYEDVLAFWFSDKMAQHWFNSTVEKDAEITRRYESLWVQVISDYAR